MRTLTLAVITIAGGCFSVFSSSAFAAEAKTFGPDPQVYQTMVGRAIQFLAAQQSEDGALSPQIGIGPTALATLGLLRTGRSVTDPQVAKGLKYLEEYVQESGGIHMPGGHIPTYETCIALVCFKEANRDGRYGKTIKAAENSFAAANGMKAGARKSLICITAARATGARLGLTCRTPPS